MPRRRSVRIFTADGRRNFWQDQAGAKQLVEQRRAFVLCEEPLELQLLHYADGSIPLQPALSLSVPPLVIRRAADGRPYAVAIRDSYLQLAVKIRRVECGEIDSLSKRATLYLPRGAREIREGPSGPRETEG